MLLLGCLTLWAVLTAGTASAMVYAPISDADLLAKSDRVVLGEVVEVRQADDARMPSIDYVVWVDLSVKAAGGDAGSGVPRSVVVRVPGGQRDNGLSMWIPGTPRLAVGEKILLFLADSGFTTSGEVLTRLREHTLGLFHVVDVADRQLAVRSLGDAAKVYLADTAGQGAKGLSTSIERREDWPRDLVGFTRWMQARNGSGEAAPKSGSAFDIADYEVDPATLGPSFGEKYSLLLSRSDESFGSCGEDGGRPIRRFEFDPQDTDGEPQVPVSIPWRVHFAAPPGAVNAFREALEVWQADPATPVLHTFDGLTSASGVLHSSDSINALRFDDPFDDIPGVFDGSGVLALGGPWFYCHHHDHRGQEFHEIAEGDIVIQDGVPEAFEATPWPDRLMAQLFAHELGHTLGIGHSDAPQALMQAVLHLDPRGPALEPDDLAALEFLYTASPDAVSTPPKPDVPQAVTDRGPYVRLSWPPVEGASNYRIERRRIPGSWSFLTTVAANGTEDLEYEDIYVDPEVTYDYKLRSQNAAGSSGASPFVRLTTGPDGRPAAPSQLRSFPTDSGGLGLRWQANSCDIDSQSLAVDSGEGYQTLLTTLAGGRIELLVTGLQDDVDYGFRLTAQNRWGTSLPSEPVVTEPLASEGTCSWRPGADYLCLDHRRYRVALEYWDEAAAAWILAEPRPEESGRGYFSFFDTNNLEVEVSLVRDSAGAPKLRWTSLTDLPWRVDVYDTVSFDSWNYELESSLCIGSVVLTPPIDIPPPIPGPGVPLTAGDFESLPAQQTTSAGGFRLHAVETVDVKAAPPEVPCGRAPTDLYLDGGRFLARLSWRDDFGVRREARALDLTDATGGFEMSTNDELGWLVKLLDGRAVNGNYWLFASPMAAAAAYEAELEITDLEVGISRVYRRGSLVATTPGEELPACAVGDISAFDG